MNRAITTVLLLNVLTACTPNNLPPLTTQGASHMTEQANKDRRYFNIIKIMDVGLFTSNKQAMHEFYTSLKLKHVYADDGISVFNAGEQDINVLTNGDQPDWLGTTQADATSVGLLVDSIDGVVAMLKDKGIEYAGPKPIYRGFIGVRVKDPDGNNIHFLQWPRD
jgi:catechol 2,3-dioxygenase-like lactoylglutathione lyase family enzyme